MEKYMQFGLALALVEIIFGIIGLRGPSSILFSLANAIGFGSSILPTVVVVLIAAAWTVRRFLSNNNNGKPISRTTSDQESRSHTFFRSCDKPTTEPVTGQVTGQIPKWLEGTLVRNGSGIYKIGDDTYNHLFDGLSVLHRYHISQGQATYTSRALDSDTYKKNMRANRIVVSEFGTAGFPDPCLSLFQRFQSTFSSLTGAPSDMTDNCGVTVGYYGDQLYAMTETNVTRRIDPVDLKTIGGKTTITDYVAVNQATAHPHALPDGSMLNMGNNYRHKKGPHYCIIKVPPTFGSQETSFKGAKIIGEIPFSSKRRPCYYHSFGMTTNHIIFIESPLRTDLLELMKMNFTGTAYCDTISWSSDVKAKFHVVSINDGSRCPIVYEADAFFTFHHINAYEEDGQIVVDVAGYDTGNIISSVKYARIDEVSSVGSEATARRFVLPLNVPQNATPGQNLVTLKTQCGKSYLNPDTSTPAVTRIHCESYNLTNDWQELPRINYKYNGQKYNFFYALSSSDPPVWSTPETNVITKVDITKNEVKTWSEEGMIPSEPIFVANPNSNNTNNSNDDPSKEDEGVILSALMRKNDEAAVDLLILNAKDMKEIARAKFKTAGTFTGTFHGQWAHQGNTVHLF